MFKIKNNILRRISVHDTSQKYANNPQMKRIVSKKIQQTEETFKSFLKQHVGEVTRFCRI